MWLWFSESLKLRQRKQSPLYQIELYDHDKSTPFRAKLWVSQRSRSCGLEDRRTQISVCSRVLHQYSINIWFNLNWLVTVAGRGKVRFQFGWWLYAYFVGGSSSRRVKVGVGQNFCQHPSRKLLLMLLWKSPRIQERAGSLALHLYSNIFGNELRRCNALHDSFEIWCLPNIPQIQHWGHLQLTNYCALWTVGVSVLQHLETASERRRYVIPVLAIINSQQYLPMLSNVC